MIEGLIGGIISILVIVLPHIFEAIDRHNSDEQRRQRERDALAKFDEDELEKQLEKRVVAHSGTPNGVQPLPPEPGSVLPPKPVS